MSQGEGGGRPPIFDNAEDLQKAVDNYFDYCDDPKNNIIKQVVQGKEIIKVHTPIPYTMAGLARKLEMSRETLNEYGKSEMFSDILMRARERVHEANITLAMTGCHDSRIAALNLASNFGYASKTEAKIDIGHAAAVKELEKKRLGDG